MADTTLLQTYLLSRYGGQALSLNLDCMLPWEFLKKVAQRDLVGSYVPGKASGQGRVVLPDERTVSERTVFLTPAGEQAFTLAILVKVVPPSVYSPISGP